VARDLVKVPKEFMKLHKEVFLTVDLFFVKKIPFFLTFSHVVTSQQSPMDPFTP